MPQAPSQTARRRPRIRRATVVRHLVLSVALWITFVIYWRIVLVRGVEREASLAGLLLILFVFLQVVFTQAWIFHNRRLARKMAGRRRRRPEVRVSIRTDFLGRRIERWPPSADLTRIPYVCVRIEGGERKTFVAGLLVAQDLRKAT